MRTERVDELGPAKKGEEVNTRYISLLLLHSVQLERPKSFRSSQEDDRSKKLAAGKSNCSIRLSGSCLVSTELELLSF